MCCFSQKSCMKEYCPPITIPLCKMTHPRTASSSPFSFQVISFKLPSDPEALQISGLQISSESGKRVEERINPPPVSKPWNNNTPVNLIREKFHGKERRCSPLEWNYQLCWSKMGPDQGWLRFGFSSWLSGMDAWGMSFGWGPSGQGNIYKVAQRSLQKKML